mgnify:CR=1 FL=1
MEKIWHKKKKTRILLIIIANVMVISMMLGIMSIMSYAELSMTYNRKTYAEL